MIAPQSELPRSELKAEILKVPQEELLDFLKSVLSERLEVLQEVVDWAVPDLVYGSARSLTDTRYHGTIKSFSEKNGYGFIASPEITHAFGMDLFVSDKQIRGFNVGTEVSFAILLNKGKPQGFDLSPASGSDKGSSKGSGKWCGKGCCKGGCKGKGDGFGGNFDVYAGWDPHGVGSCMGCGPPLWDPCWDCKGGSKGIDVYGKGCYNDWNITAGGASSKGSGYADWHWDNESMDSKAGNMDNGYAAWANGCGPPYLDNMGGCQWGKGCAGGKADRSNGGSSSHGQLPPLASAVEVPGVTDRRFNGSIKSFKANKFGFLTCEELQKTHNQDIFVHWSHLGEFQVGDNVSFSVIVNTQGGLKAVDLRAAESGVGEMPPSKRPRT